MSDTLKLFPPPADHKWQVDHEDGYYRITLLRRHRRHYITAMRYWGCVPEVDVFADSPGEFMNWERNKDRNDNPRTLHYWEVDRRIWDKTRSMATRYARDNRPHEYVTEWEDA